MTNQGFLSAFAANKRASWPPAEWPITIERVMSIPGKSASWPQARNTSESVSIQTPSSPSLQPLYSIFHVATPASARSWAMGFMSSLVHELFQKPPWMSMTHGRPASFSYGEGSSGICKSAYCHSSAPHCMRSTAIIKR